MTYKRPAVTVIQEFTALVPDVVAFNLPVCSIGPAYQLVNNDLLGTYAGLQRDYSYAKLLAGAQVDLEVLAEDEQFPITKKPVSVAVKNANILVIGESASGSINGQLFSDASVDKFSKVVAGDILVVIEKSDVTILDSQINGATFSGPGLTKRLGGTAQQFADVKVGDTVSITAGTNAIIGDHVVTAKPNNGLLAFNTAVNDGGGDSTDTEFTIAGTRGNINKGEYVVKSKTDSNNLVLQSPLAEVETLVSYTVKRKVDSIALVRGTDYTASADKISIPAGIMTAEGFEIISGSVSANYRALRNDMSGVVRKFEKISDLTSMFGSDQITPANPVAYSVSSMFDNTTTAVHCLVLDGNTDEKLSYQDALETLERSEMYALVPMTHSPVIHQLLKTHVVGLSAAGKTRVAIINRLLVTEQLIQDASIVSTDVTNSRIIVNTQIDGVADVDYTFMNDSTPDQFLNVNVGDTVIVVGGTNAILGNKEVLEKTNSNKIKLSGAIATGASTNIQYYIVRKDGIGADGVTLYDRNANFIADGVKAGQFVRFLSGSIEGFYRITGVLSDKQLSVTQIPGIVSLKTGFGYEIYRTLSKAEQAEVISGYSSAFASRRVVNSWPDVLNTTVGNSVEKLPGYYGCLIVGALTTGLPTQQGFTNMEISGFLSLEHSSSYFTDNQLDAMADGGTMIFAQDNDQSAIYIRHQLTTDRSAIKFQEYSMTKNVDFADKFIKIQYRPYIGKYNIYDGTLDELKTNAKAVIGALKDKFKVSKIGGVIKNGVLKSLAENPDKIDSVKMRFGFDFPIPLNDLEITVEV